MDSQTTFDIFPEQALDNSIITAVLIGLIILLLFTEIFGSVFVGYVVPGYLATVFLTLPESGIAIVLEAIVTYVIVWAISEQGSKLGLWARFFGRERFLLFVYISVGVRLLMETILLPRLGYLSVEVLGIPLKNDFFSIGLVLVPLLANSCWKTGLSRGLTQTGIVTLLTYLILLLVVMPYTNLNLSKFELTYENVALNFTESPKLYMILLTGALLASSYNLRYGWDYNGIMMPALLAIAFFYPVKIVTTFVEAMILAGLFIGFSKLPVINRFNFGGGRKITMIFFLGFCLKWILAAFFPSIPTLHVTDLFGFGYLLPSLLGAKILQKRNPFIVLFPTFNAALYSIILGSFIAFAFHLLDEALHTEEQNLRRENLESIAAKPGIILRDMLLSKAYVLSGTGAENTELTFKEISQISRTISHALTEKSAAMACDNIERANNNTIHKTTSLECTRKIDSELGEYILVRERIEERFERRGYGVVIYRPGAKGPILQIPHPLSDPLSIEASFAIMRMTDARGIILAGYDEPQSQARWTNARIGKKTVFHWIYEQMRHREVVQIRTAASGDNTWSIRYSLPYSLHLQALRKELGNIQLNWSPPLEQNIQWSSALSNTFSILTLTERTVSRASPLKKYGTLARHIRRPISLTGLVERWMVEQKDFIHKANTSNYTKPLWTDIELLESEIFKRFLSLSELQEDSSFSIKLSSIQLVAQFLGYEIVRFSDTNSNTEYLILKEDVLQGTTKGWGTVVLRLGPARPWIWIVPRPLSEAGTIASGARWFDQFNSRAFVIPGASYRSDPYGRNDILSMSAPRSIPHTFLHQFMREFRNESQLLTIMIRGARSEQIVDDVMLSTGDELATIKDLSTPALALFKSLDEQGVKTELFTGKNRQIGLQGLGNPLAGLVRIRHPGRYVTLWLSDITRESLFEGHRLEQFLKRTTSAGISHEYSNSSDLRRLLDPSPNLMPRAISNPPSKELYDLLMDFATHQNLVAAQKLKTKIGPALRLLVDLRETRIYAVAQNHRVRCFSIIGYGGLDLRVGLQATPKEDSLDYCVQLESSAATRGRTR